LPFLGEYLCWAQLLGVQYLSATVGQFKEEAKPLDMVVPDQFIDRTNRDFTFLKLLLTLLLPIDLYSTCWYRRCDRFSQFYQM